MLFWELSFMFKNEISMEKFGVLINVENINRKVLLNVKSHFNNKKIEILSNFVMFSSNTFEEFNRIYFKGN